MGVLDRIKRNAKKGMEYADSKYKKYQAEESRKGTIYKEAYKKAEMKEIKNKAKRDAKARYSPPKKTKGKQRNMLNDFEGLMVK